MKTIDPLLAAHLGGGVTTLCHCWRLERADAVVLGFTDHDRPLAFDGVTFAAASGLSASALASSLGLGADNLEVSGALSDEAITEEDLIAGRYDDAAFTLWRVNWQDPAQRVILKTGHLGEVRRGPLAFTAELRGLAARLAQPTGRLYQYTCDAELGDGRCGIDLDLAAYRGEGTVLGAEPARFLAASGLLAFESGWFTGGAVLWTTGANAGLKADVKLHGRSGTSVTIELWDAPAHPPAEGDAFIVTAGCDKTFATCRDRFANVARFRGFPHMPGNDWVVSYPRAGEANDGGSLAGGP